MPLSVPMMFIAIGMMFTTLGTAQHNPGFGIAGIGFCVAALIMLLGRMKK